MRLFAALTVAHASAWIVHIFVIRPNDPPWQLLVWVPYLVAAFWLIATARTAAALLKRLFALWVVAMVVQAVVFAGMAYGWPGILHSIAWWTVGFLVWLVPPAFITLAIRWIPRDSDVRAPTPKARAMVDQRRRPGLHEANGRTADLRR